MKTTPGALLTEFKRPGQKTAHGWKCTRLDGQVFGFTDHDMDKTVSGVVYKAKTGLTRTAVLTSAQFSVDNQDISGGLNSAGITEADILAGKWDYAAVECFRFDWSNPSLGIDKVRKAYIGSVKRGKTTFVAELRGLMQFLQQSIGKLLTPGCPYQLGDPDCQVRLLPPVWAAGQPYTVRVAGAAETGSVVRPSTPNNRHFKCTTAGTSGGGEPVWNTGIGATTNDNTVVWTAIQASTVYGEITSVTDRITFFDASRTEADHRFSNGVITFLSGQNVGVSREIQLYELAGGKIRLQIPTPYDVAIGDDYEMVLGCRKDYLADCKNIHDNLTNFGGYPYLPGNEQLVTGGV